MNLNCNSLKSDRMNWINELQCWKKNCSWNIDCNFQKKKKQNFWLMKIEIVFDESDVQKMNEHRENWMKVETHKKCQLLNEMIHTINSRILQLLIDWTLHRFEQSRITIESQNEWFCALQSQKHLDETDELDEKIFEVYEAMTDEKDQLMHLWNLDLKIFEKHWRTDICEKNKHFDVFQMREVVKKQTTIEKDMQRVNHTEKKIWQRVFQQFIEALIQRHSA